MANRQTSTGLLNPPSADGGYSKNMTLLPTVHWNKIQQALQQLTEASKLNNMISEEDAAALLGIKPETLAKRVSDKSITEEYYTKSPLNGARFYDKKKLLGL